MKHLKTKLSAAIVMVVISALMLTGVSFAWYTLSTNPEVTNIKASVAANENLEIALDNGYASETAVNQASTITKNVTKDPQGSRTGNPYTWGNLVNLNTAMETMNPAEGTDTAPKILLAPVKYVTGTLNFPKYGLDGRISSTNNPLTEVFVTDHADFTKDTIKGGVAGYKQTATSTVYDAFSVTYWLRSNEACNVTLGSGTKRAYSANDANAGTTDVNGVVGNGSYIAFKINNSGVATENTVDVVEKYVKNLVIRLDDVTSTTVTTVGYCKLTKVNAPAAETDATFVGEDASDWVWFKLDLINKLNSAFDSEKDVLTETEGKNNVSTTVTLAKDTAKKIKMWVYIDGETVTNADALLDDCQMKLNVQFSSSEITTTDGPGAINGTTS